MFSRRSYSFSAWPGALGHAALILLAGTLGVLLAQLPLMWSVMLLIGLAVGVAMLIEPLAGLALVLLVGPTKPLTDFFVPQLPLDLGQITLGMTLFMWILHKAHDRRLVIPATPLNLPLMVFVGAGLLSAVGALSLGYALEEIIKWGQIIVVMWLVIDMSDGRWRAVAAMLLAAGIVQALIGVWQFGLRGDGPDHFLILDERFYRAYGTFEQPNPYGGFLGLILPLGVGLALGAFSLWARAAWEVLGQRREHILHRVVRAVTNRHLLTLIAFGGLAGLLLAALLMSWSRGAWLGFGVAAMAILLAWPRKASLGAALVIGAVVLGMVALRFNLLPDAIASRATGFTDFVTTFDVRGVDINDANYSVLERLAHWQTAREMARYNPLLGVGIGNYEPVYPAYALANWPQPLGHAHNIYLNVLAEMGIMGLSAYIALWAVVLWQTWRATRAELWWQRMIAVGMFGDVGASECPQYA